MSDYNIELFASYLLSSYEEVLSYFEYVELVNSNRLPDTCDTDMYAAGNTGNSLTVSQRASS